MKRSDFIKNGAALLGSTVLLNNQTMANEQLTKNATNATFKLDYAPHQGMFSATAGKIS